MKPLYIIAKSLIQISRNLYRIRNILEIVFKDKLEYHEQIKQFSKLSRKEKDSDREFIASDSPLLDQYGEPLEQIEEEQLETKSN